IKIRRVRKGDLSKVRDVIEQAFGDYFERLLGTRPRQVFGGAQYVHHRWLMEPWGCFVAEENDGKIIGAFVAVMWGTVGLGAPLLRAGGVEEEVDAAEGPQDHERDLSRPRPRQGDRDRRRAGARRHVPPGERPRARGLRGGPYAWRQRSTARLALRQVPSDR